MENEEEEEEFVLSASGQSAVTVTGCDRQLCLCACPSVYSLCVLTLLMCAFPPKARRWRGCTAWQGRTWHRWRLWCSAWDRPPSPSSSPSPESSPHCEGENRRWDEGAGESSRSETIWCSKVAKLEGEKSLSGPFRCRRKKESATQSFCHSHTAVQKKIHVVRESAVNLKAMFRVFTSLLCANSLLWTPRRLCGHWLLKASCCTCWGKIRTAKWRSVSAISMRTKLQRWGAFEKWRSNSVHQQKHHISFSVKHQPHQCLSTDHNDHS